MNYNLADAVLALAPIEAQLPQPLSLASVGDKIWQPIRALFQAAGLRAPVLNDSGRLPAIDRVAMNCLIQAQSQHEQARAPEQWIKQANLTGLVGLSGIATQRWLSTTDGVSLSTFYTHTSPRAEHTLSHPMLLIGAPGMPTQLLTSWLRGLGQYVFVATWETRGLFGANTLQSQDLDIAAQINDALNVIDTLQSNQIHVLGICGGAVLALALAAQFPKRIRSLSLWFGDYELGEQAPKTDHQRNLLALMQMVVNGQISAETLRTLLLDTAVKDLAPDIGPLILYPYANETLLSRYCHLNTAIMTADCKTYLPHILAPSLVVYGLQDQTTHPAGSRWIAEQLGSELVAVPELNHLDGFRGRQADIARAQSFHHRFD